MSINLQNIIITINLILITITNNNHCINNKNEERKTGLAVESLPHKHHFGKKIIPSGIYRYLTHNYTQTQYQVVEFFSLPFTVLLLGTKINIHHHISVPLWDHTH